MYGNRLNENISSHSGLNINGSPQMTVMLNTTESVTA